MALSETFGAVFAVLIVTSTLAAGGAGPQRATLPGPTPTGTNTSLTEATIERDIATLEALAERMATVSTLYDALADRQRERTALREGILTQEFLQRIEFANLTRFLRSVQDEPEALDRLRYAIGEALDAFTTATARVGEERRLVGRIRRLVVADQRALANLTTPLVTPLAAQRETHLSGLETLDEALLTQEGDLVELQAQQRSRLTLVGLYLPIWRDIDSGTRRQVLGDIEAALVRSARRTATLASRGENQHLLTDILQAHHEARLATVQQFRTLLDSVSTAVETVRERPGTAPGVRADLGSMRADRRAVRDLLSSASPPAQELGAALDAHTALRERRLTVLGRQRTLLAALAADRTKAQQNRTIAALSRRVDAERATLEAMAAHIRAEQRAVTRLYGVFGDLDPDQRGLRYLDVRDRILDLLSVAIERLARDRVAALSDVQARASALGRIEATWSLQQRRRQVGRLRAQFADDRVDVATLGDRLTAAVRVFDWLGALRREVDGTVAAEVALLSRARERVSTLAVTPTVQPTPTPSIEATPADAGDTSRGDVLLSMALVVALLAALLGVVAVSNGRDRSG